MTANVCYCEKKQKVKSSKPSVTFHHQLTLPVFVNERLRSLSDDTEENKRVGGGEK